MAIQRYVFLVRSNEDLPRHQMAEACLTAGRQLAAPWRYQMFQDPCISQRRSHMRPGTMVASSGVHTQPRTAHDAPRALSDNEIHGTSALQNSCEL